MKRIIPCLDVSGGRVVKGVNFVGLRDVGDVVELGRRYADDGADELVSLDISATGEGRRTRIDIIERLAAAITIPLTVGGGIATLDDAARVQRAGASRVSIGSAAVHNPQFINELAGRWGSDFVVAAIDGRLDSEGEWRVATHGGARVTGLGLYDWAREVADRGAGQILFTSMEHDGTRNGYPLDVFARLADLTGVPVIASGGAGSVDDIAAVLTSGGADAALAASIFHFGEVTIPALKRELAARGINVKL